MTDAAPRPPRRSSACGGSAGGSAASTAVRDVDLDVAPGERRAILGPNGAGKTTLFNVISGDMPASVGDDRVPGPGRRRDPRAGPHAAGMGRTYQKSRLFLGLTVEDNLYLAVLGTRSGHLRR